MHRNKLITESPTECTSPGCCQPELSRRSLLVAAGAFASGIAAAPLMAASSRDGYAALVKADRSLRGYWRFDGDLVDALGEAPARAVGGLSFVEGVAGGRAVSLAPNEPITVDNTDHLRGRSATVELFFKLDSPPTGPADPVLIAQTAGRQVRFIVGVKNDLSALVYRNVKDEVLTTIHLPTAQPVAQGRWHHLAITGYDLDLRAYVDGYECSLVGGAFEFTRQGPAKAPMTFGATSIDGWASGGICLDEVACYARGLTEKEIQQHLRAAGWGKRLEQTGAAIGRVKAERDAARARKQAAALKDPSLTAAGATRVYGGEHLDAISFTVGGIGAGGIQFNGKGEPAVWQIACNHEEHRVGDSFLAVRAQPAGGRPVVRALQTEPVGPFQAMASLEFEGEYPFARYRFSDPALPVEVQSEVFNPFIPMDLKNSAIPCVIYTVTARNLSAAPAQVDVLAAQKNALGYHEGQQTANYGGNHNEVMRREGATVLHMTRRDADRSDMVLLTRGEGATGAAAWQSIERLHDAFDARGECDGPVTSGVSPAGQTVNGVLTAPIELAPGESKSVTFVLTWCFHSGMHGQKKPWRHRGQNYTNWWRNALEVAQHLLDNLDELTARTRRFHDTLYASSLPVWLLDRLSSQLAVLRSQTCWWAEDGYFGAWEGCNPTDGCCPGNCTHVWHYAQGHARLLPELGRKMREQDYATQSPDGKLPHRHTMNGPAADGHFGTILNTYREHLCSADDGWLRAQWPQAKRALDWGIDHWNPNRDGYMQATQHNTLDGAFSGCSSWIGSLYLAALEAGARMAERVGDSASASEYRRIRASGKRLQNQRLWNGEYYVQVVGQKRQQDYLDGCHIDQLLGEWWADQVGIGRSYPQDRSRRAMEALLRHNYLADFHGQSLKPRQYCEVDDGGMKMITWPNSPQPIPGMKYGDEVMTGFEYGAAATLIQNGLLREGLMVVKTVADRYDGRLRTEGVTHMANGPWGYSGNPFGDDECGKFYGRSLSVWSVLLALQGFEYDGPAGRIGFRPRLTPENHASFFTAAEGYGLFSQVQEANRLEAAIALKEGLLSLTVVVLGTGDRRPRSALAKLDGRAVAAKAELQNGEAMLALEKPLNLVAGQQLEISVELA
ncbi:hypothetical protein KOR34_50210 [Posidoniimonas corsicana]|uniref:Glucosylceramidase n=1 Tax=Posidoniimonas corsicana TaxID=1938618 RepID=A0A5C5UYB9_9BACT|nr:GH116 family glycosyl-hydrolase [Posidoniimonas corsicana]TWT30462.1 hypothetical protein KOR34_50210 [Posidoniimonas corsicana]